MGTLDKTPIHRYGRVGLVLSAFLAQSLVPAVAQQSPAETIFRNVRVLDVVGGRLGSPTNVVVRGNTIAAIGSSADAASGARTIDGKGRTLMPGLIDVHVHLTFGAVSLGDLYDPKTTSEQLGTAAAKSATDMLLRGFTAVRDMGGPIFPLKRAIDSGKVRGPRIWPSGAITSQTSGHGDFARRKSARAASSASPRAPRRKARPLSPTAATRS